MFRKTVLLWLALCLAGAFPQVVHADLIGDWVLRYSPVLSPGPVGSWDAGAVLGPEVVHAGGQYRMWYTGVATQSDQYRIGYATSPDGMAWSRHPANPVLSVGSPGAWDDKSVFAPAVLFDGSTWKMWYTGRSHSTGYQVGYATSPDGIEWTKYKENPVLTLGPPGAWDEHHVLSPYVMLKDGQYHMWYSNMSTASDDGHIGYATSTDGIHWAKYGGNPVLAPDPSGDDSSVALGLVSPAVVDFFGEYNMWYGAGYLSRAGYEWIIEHHTSPDGIHWERGGAPMPLIGGPYYHYPTVIFHGRFLRMWYVSFGHIYYAEAVAHVERSYLPLVTR